MKSKPSSFWIAFCACCIAGFIITLIVVVTTKPSEAAPDSPVSGPASAAPSTQPADSTETVTPSTNQEPPRALAPLVGRWLREDGGYVVEINKVHGNGSLDVAYYNPRPIHVSNAAAALEDNAVKVGIELRDTGYPGCLYTLWHDAALDQLHGTYFQPAMGQTFDVVFIRLPQE